MACVCDSTEYASDNMGRYPLSYLGMQSVVYLYNLASYTFEIAEHVAFTSH